MASVDGFLYYAYLEWNGEQASCNIKQLSLKDMIVFLFHYDYILLKRMKSYFQLILLI
jgi:hypothetical protein